MSAYVIGQLNIHTPDAYQDYLAGFMPIFEHHGGELLATGGAEPAFGRITATKSAWSVAARSTSS